MFIIASLAIGLLFAIVIAILVGVEYEIIRGSWKIDKRKSK